MVPIPLSRRNFLGRSAAAGLALAQSQIPAPSPPPVRCGLIGLGNRGTALLRTLLDLPGAEVAAVADHAPKARARAAGIIEKSGHPRPASYEDYLQLIERPDLDAAIVALPCDLHAEVNARVLRAGKHLYAEKPLALTLGECDGLIAEASRSPGRVVHVGHQRRSNPRYLAGLELIGQGSLGAPIEARASWTSSNGPVGVGGWLGRRSRSGDWMVEQAVHVWDILHAIAGGPPDRATGIGRTGLFADRDAGRDVTDWYSVTLHWPGGFHASLTHSWIDPPDSSFTGASLLFVGTEGGFDFQTGTATFRDPSRVRRVLHAGNQPETQHALSSFLASIRSPGASPPPITLVEARDAVATGLLVRLAVDEGRTARRSEITSAAGPSGPSST